MADSSSGFRDDSTPCSGLGECSTACTSSFESDFDGWTMSEFDWHSASRATSSMGQNCAFAGILAVFLLAVWEIADLCWRGVMLMSKAVLIMLAWILNMRVSKENKRLFVSYLLLFQSVESIVTGAALAAGH